MKISKVRGTQGKGSKLTINAKAAVVINPTGQEGILYDDPSRMGESRKNDKQRESYIKDRIRASQKLYSIFNSNQKIPKNKKTESEKAIDMIIAGFSSEDGASFRLMFKDFAEILDKYAEKSYENRRNHIDESPELSKLGVNISDNQINALSNLLSEESIAIKIKKGTESVKDKVKVSERDIDSAISNCLKKCMCRVKTKKALKALLMKVFDIPYTLDGDVNIRRDFIDYAIEDYCRIRVKNSVSESIKKNNMPVQPTSSEGVTVFQMPSLQETKSTKSKEREAFNHFLSEYADLDENKRKSLRIKLRRLNDLYFYGKDATMALADNEDVDVWEDHAKHGDIKELFIKVQKPQITGDGKADKLAMSQYEDNIRTKYREANITCYRKAVEEIDNDKSLFFEDNMLNMFVLHRIESGVERIYSHIKANEEYKLQTGYVSEKVWKDLINYISIKYIAIGKAVYNYAMDELVSGDKSIEMGKINDNYISGISSFDYELIKAEEMLQRETAVYVAFAARHLAHQTVDLDEKNSDFLLFPDKSRKDKDGKNINDFIKEGINLRSTILQYFGGASSWSDFSFEKYMTDGRDDVDLLTDLQKAIYSMRNDSFHYTSKNHNNDGWNKELIGALFEYEANRLTIIQKDKFYSNNLPMFYDESNLKELLSSLYSKSVERASQVPSFNSVFVRKSFPKVCTQDLSIDVKTMNEEDKLKFYNALYFMFKEIYYNLFLNDSNVLNRFIDISTKTKKNGKGDEGTHYWAEKDFRQRILSIIESRKNYTLSQICQLIMTEYNQQNTGNMRHKSADKNGKNPDSYQHYKMLLLSYLGEAFVEFVKEKYDFVFTPVKRDLMDKEAFLPDFAKTVNPLGDLIERVKESGVLQKWYIVGRFLSPKQANQMLGSLHSYKQYVWDIYRRAEETGTKINKRVSEDTISGVAIRDIDSVLDLCVKMSGTITNNLTDYFKDKEEYAAYINDFLDFEYKTGDYNWALKDFCKEITDEDDKEGIYYDGENPIINRNIVISKLYGEAEFVSKIFKRVNKEDIKVYKDLKKNIEPYQNMGTFETKEQQENVKRFQELKNHIEFRDLVDYSEITNELQGQLVNWIYLRERDLMYFQLGFHYLCLNNNSEKPELYKKIEFKDEKVIDNAVLYQICAMYTNGLPLYYSSTKNANIKEVSAKAGTSTKVDKFYSSGIRANGESYSRDYTTYMAGLELFENTKEHINITMFRNDIEHFRYLVSNTRSMLDVYSEIFDRFFTYDMKYRKNIPNILYNILLAHFVNVQFDFSTGKKNIGTGENIYEKKCAKINIQNNGGIVSEKFTYKLKDEKTIDLPARGRRYMETVARLLYYPETVDEEKMVKDLVIKDNKPFGKKRNNKYSNRKEGASDRKKYEENKARKKDNSFMSGMDGVDWSKLNFK